MNNQDLMTVNEVAKLSGITIRTLHYYDQIELLIPSACTKSNYRLYSSMDVEKLQQIISNPFFDSKEALKNHREILFMKKKRIEDLIELVDKTLDGQHQAIQYYCK